MDPVTILARHQRGDWGDLEEEDKLQNVESVREGNQLLSAYEIQPGIRVWIITEWDRSVTTILLPEDY